MTDFIARPERPRPTAATELPQISDDLTIAAQLAVDQLCLLASERPSEPRRRPVEAHERERETEDRHGWPQGRSKTRVHTHWSAPRAPACTNSCYKAPMLRREGPSGGGEASNKLDEDPLVCNCLAVRESEILHAIRSGADSVNSVGQYCEAGTGCTSCHEPIRVLLRDHARLELAHSRAPKSLRQLTLFDDVGVARRSRAPSGSHKR